MTGLYLLVETTSELVEIIPTYDEWCTFRDYETQKDEYYIRVYLDEKDLEGVIFTVGKLIAIEEDKSNNHVRELFFIPVDDSDERIDLLDTYRRYKKMKEEIGLLPDVILLESL